MIYNKLQPSDIVRSILLGIGVCYLARLETATREVYAKHISSKIQNMLEPGSSNGGDLLIEQISWYVKLYIFNNSFIKKIN